jgi:hypothetical protein
MTGSFESLASAKMSWRPANTVGATTAAWTTCTPARTLSAIAWNSAARIQN